MEERGKERGDGGERGGMGVERGMGVEERVKIEGQRRDDRMGKRYNS